MPNTHVDDLDRQQALLGMLDTRMGGGGAQSAATPQPPPAAPSAPRRRAAKRPPIQPLKPPEQRLKEILRLGLVYTPYGAKGGIPLANFGPVGRELMREVDPETGFSATNIDPNAYTPEQLEEVMGIWPLVTGGGR